MTKLKIILKKLYHYMFEMRVDSQKVEENLKVNQLKAMSHQGFLL